MPSNESYGSYIDEFWTKRDLLKITEEDKRVTETINSSKSVVELQKQTVELQKQTVELQRQNDLYEKEITTIRKNGKTAKWAAIISASFSALAAILSAAIPIILRYLP